MSKPTAVIITLEDSASWLDKRLILAYLRTTYRCFPPYGGGIKGGVFDLKIGTLHFDFDRWLEQQNFRHFAFITAWNPGSQPLTTAENERRNWKLEKELYDLAKKVIPGVAEGDDKNWPPEPGFFILDISPENAVNLGWEFGQNALVFGQKEGVPELWWLPKP